MNAGDKNDQYVDFLGAILTKVQMQLKNGNENLFLQFYYVIFLTSTKTIPRVVLSLASFKNLVSFMSTKAAPM